MICLIASSECLCLQSATHRNSYLQCRSDRRKAHTLCLVTNCCCFAYDVKRYRRTGLETQRLTSSYNFVSHHIYKLASPPFNTKSQHLFPPLPSLSSIFQNQSRSPTSAHYPLSNMQLSILSLSTLLIVATTVYANPVAVPNTLLKRCVNHPLSPATTQRLLTDIMN